MNNEELKRKLNSVGRAAFVEYFELFESYSNGKIQKDKCIEELVKNGVSNESGAAIRCSNAILIFKAKKEKEALQMVLESKRLPFNVMKKAVEILKP